MFATGMKCAGWVTVLLCCALDLISQTDSLSLGEVLVSATRTQRTLASLPMPVQLIREREIRMTGASRLQDILAEQPGLTVVPQVNGLGNGIQFQGLNPDYTMIMVDGEPLIGRYTGSLELSRLALGNIRQIELVKGPSSSLYGSEAMAGVVNLLTRTCDYDKVQGEIRYGSMNTWDGSLEGHYRLGKVSLSAFGNHYRSSGFDHFPDVYGQTVAPYYNTSLHTKAQIDLGRGHVLTLSARSFSEVQDNHYQVLTGVDSIRVSGNAYIRDRSVNPRAKWKLGPSVFLQTGFYYTDYYTNTRLYSYPNDKLYYTDTFDQSFMRPDVLLQWKPTEGQQWVVGLGMNHEQVATSRYGDADQKSQTTWYALLQHEWKPLVPLEIVSGIRVDENSIYGSQWSPKLAALYRISNRWSAKASYGKGFRAPDFRYLYLNFHNTAAPYTVLGTEQVEAQMRDLEARGELQQLLVDPSDAHHLDAERSSAVNAGLRYDDGSRWKMEFNFFRNDLRGLIESIPLAVTNDRRTYFTYANLKSAYTQGLECSVAFEWSKGWRFLLSGQVLDARDVEVLNAVKAGEVYGRDPVTKASYRLKTNDYFGLYNRSRYTGNFKIFYSPQNSPWNGSLRICYRSKFGIQQVAGSVQGIERPFSDLNANGVLDRYDHFVDSYWMLHVAVGRHLSGGLRIQAGADNLLNYKDPYNLPHISGRQLFFKIQYSLFKKNTL